MKSVAARYQTFIESCWAQLVRHFLSRFADNELVSAQSDMHVTVTKILALLAVPGMIITFYLLPKYTALSFSSPAVREAASLVDKYFYITFTTVVMGCVTVLEWDALFPDRRDFMILTPLPIRGRTVFTAKITALVLFLLIFSVDVNALSSLLYPLVSAPPRIPTIEMLPRLGIHLAAVFGASAFVFFFFIALQGTVMNLLSARLFRRVSPYLQFLSLLALVLMFFLLPKTASLVDTLQKTNSALPYLLPPMWFTGLYEVMSGQNDAIFRDLAAIARDALGVVLALSLVTYLLSYRRHLKRSLEIEDDLGAEPSLVERALTWVADRVLVVRPAERAVFYFVGKTMVRSKKHWLYLAAYVGVGFAFVLEGLIAMLSRGGLGNLAQPGTVLLSVPLVLSFFVLSGMRVIFAVPVELRANWIFQMTEDERRAQCLTGVRKAMAVFGIAPLLAALAPIYCLLWGWRTTLLHTLFVLVLSLILEELLLLNFHKIPFTCSYQPGKANITHMWVFYWFCFTTYAFTMASFENWMLRDPVRLVVFYAVAVVVLFRLAHWRRQELDGDFSFIFEDEPEPVVRTLGLSQ